MIKHYLTCKECGKKFRTSPSKIKDGRKFCCKECKYKYWRGNNHPNWKGGLIKRKCQICNKEFWAIPAAVKKGRGKFCSHGCQNLWRSQHIVKENHHNWNSILRTCQICGKEFHRKACHVKKNWGRYCSRKCQGEWQSKTLIGENSNNWKGGLWPIHYQVRASNEYMQWRRQVFARDNFTCCECGDKRWRNLRAHHIKRFVVILNDIKQKYPLLSIVDMAKHCPDLWNIRNGITLCEKCHRKAHAIKRRICHAKS